MHKKAIILTKPIFIGASILDSSKLLMYKLHYDVLLKSYPDACMLKTDTDSLLYHILTDDVYKDMKQNHFYKNTLNLVIILKIILCTMMIVRNK